MKSIFSPIFSPWRLFVRGYALEIISSPRIWNLTPIKKTCRSIKYMHWSQYENDAQKKMKKTKKRSLNIFPYLTAWNLLSGLFRQPNLQSHQPVPWAFPCPYFVFHQHHLAHLHQIHVQEPPKPYSARHSRLHWDWRKERMAPATRTERRKKQFAWTRAPPMSKLDRSRNDYSDRSRIAGNMTFEWPWPWGQRSAWTIANDSIPRASMRWWIADLRVARRGIDEDCWSRLYVKQCWKPTKWRVDGRRQRGGLALQWRHISAGRADVGQWQYAPRQSLINNIDQKLYAIHLNVSACTQLMIHRFNRALHTYG